METKQVRHERGFIRFFRSEYFVLITFVLIIAPLMMHTAHLLLQVSSIQSEVYAYFFAISFDLAIFAFSINGRRPQATGLAFIVFTLNICFFNLGPLGDMLGDPRLVRLFVTVIISAAGSWIVHSYVVFFNEKIGERRVVSEWRSRYHEKERQVATIEAKVDRLQSEIGTLQTELARSTEHAELLRGGWMGELIPVSQVPLPFTCGNCGQTAPTLKGVEGLARPCKNRHCRLQLENESEKFLTLENHG